MTEQNIAKPGLWLLEAKCAGADLNTFFPSVGQRAREAKNMCKQCPVQTECLQWAIKNNERYGIWGGLTEVERRNLKNGKPVRELADHSHLRLKGAVTDMLPAQDQDRDQHGYARYRNKGCRCDRCKEGFAEYHRLYETYRYATKLCLHCDSEYSGRGRSPYCSNMCKRIAEHLRRRTA